MTPATIVRAFVEAINRRSPEEIAALMTEDHAFIDSLGNRVTGRDQMRKGWQGYFNMVPDFTITLTEAFSDGPVVVMVGSAQGTLLRWRGTETGESLADSRGLARGSPRVIDRRMARLCGQRTDPQDRGSSVGSCPLAH